MNLKQQLHRIGQNERLHSFLDRVSLAKPRNQQIAAIVLAIAMALTILFVIGWSYALKQFAPVDTRDYRYIPFDEYDATMICRDEMKARAGPELLRSYVDSHSTRMDNRKGIYRIYMIADLGSHDDYREVSVHCFVDKWSNDISHYKQFDGRKTILSSDLKFFKE
jgi:hypothetical protein